MSSSQLKPFFLPCNIVNTGILALVYSVIITIETTVITIGNSFTVFVFCSRMSFLKRAYYLLLNLAVTVLLVGLTELMNTALTTFHMAG